MAAEFRIGAEGKFQASFARTAHDLKLPQEKSYKRLKRSSWQQRKLYVEVVNQDISRFDSTIRPEIKRYEITAKVVQVLTALMILTMPIFFMYLPAWFTWGVGLPTFLILGMIKGKVESTVEEKNRLYDALLIMRTLLMEQSIHALRPIGEWDLSPIDQRLKSDLMMQEDLKKQHPQSANHLNRLLSNISSCDCLDHPKPDKSKMRHCLDLEASPTAMMNAVRELAQFPDRKEDWGAIKKRVSEANGHLARGELNLYEEKMAGARLDALMIGGPFGDIRQEKAKAQLNLLFSDSSPSPQNQVRALVANFQYFNQIYEKELYPLYKEWNRLFKGDFWKKYGNFLQFAREIKEEIDKLIPLLTQGEEVSQRKWLEVLEVAKEMRVQTMTDQLILQTSTLKELLKSQVEGHPTKRIPNLKSSLENLNQKILSAGAIDYLEGWIENHPEQARLPIDALVHESQKKMELLPKQQELHKWIGNNLQAARRPIRKLVNQLPKEVREWFQRNPQAANLPLDALLYQSQIHSWLRLNEENQLLAQDSVIEIKERNHVMRFAFQQVENQARSLDPTMEPDDLAAFKQELDALRKLVSCKGASSRAGMVWKSFWRKLPPHGFDPIKIPKEKGWARANKIKELVVKRELKAIDAKELYLNRVRHYGLQVIAGFVIFVVQAIFWSNPYVLWGLSAAGLLIQSLFIYFGDYIKGIDQQKQGIKLQGILHNEPQLKRLPGSRPALHELKKAQNVYNLDGVERTWARITTEGDEKVLSDPWRAIAKQGSKEADSTLRRELQALLRLRSKDDETLLNLLKGGDGTLLNLLAEANLTRKELWTANELKERIEQRIDKLRASLYLRVKKQTPRTLNRLYDEVNHAVQSRRKIEMDLEQVKGERRKIERLMVYRYVQEKVAEAFQGEHERQTNEDLGIVLEKIKKIIRRMYEVGGNREDRPLLEQECEKLKYFPVDRLNEMRESLDEIRRKMETWDQRFVQESLLFERASEIVKKWKEEVALKLPPLEKNYRIIRYVKNQIDQACLGEGARDALGDLQSLISSISQIAEPLYAEEEGLDKENLIQLCKQLKGYPLNQLQSWATYFNTLLNENNQRIQEQVKKQFHVVALELRLPNFGIEQSLSYEQIFQIEEKKKEQLYQARLQEREKKIRFALEKQVKVMRLDQEIAKKKRELHNYVRRQRDSKIKQNLARRVEKINQFLEQQKRVLSTALAEGNIKNALETWIERFQDSMQRQVDGIHVQEFRLLILALLESEKKIAKLIQNRDNLIPELNELIYDEVPEIPLSNIEKFDNFLKDSEDLWDGENFAGYSFQLDLRQRYKGLTLSEKLSVWWRLPKGFREELV